MRLTTGQRALLYLMFGGHCAYCGHPLTKTWQGDHIEPLKRDWWYTYQRKRWIDGGRRGPEPVSNGPEHPERDNIKNLFPSCRACNIDKHCLSLEHWRQSLEQRVDVCRRNHSAFRHAERFGLVKQVETKVVFYFEKLALEAA